MDDFAKQYNETAWKQLLDCCSDDYDVAIPAQIKLATILAKPLRDCTYNEFCVRSEYWYHYGCGIIQGL